VQLTSPPRRVLAACMLAAAGVLCARIGVSANAILCLAPALALAGMLGLRRYPGERILTSLRRRARGPRPRTDASAPAIKHRDAAIPRGALLMAFALAVRPPPVTSPTT
jgi:hypothetical protein